MNRFVTVLIVVLVLSAACLGTLYYIAESMEQPVQPIEKVVPHENFRG